MGDRNRDAISCNRSSKQERELERLRSTKQQELRIGWPCVRASGPRGQRAWCHKLERLHSRLELAHKLEHKELVLARKLELEHKLERKELVLARSRKQQELHIGWPCVHASEPTSLRAWQVHKLVRKRVRRSVRVHRQGLERKQLELASSNRSCDGTNRPTRSTKKPSRLQLRPKQPKYDAFETLPKLETTLFQRVSTPWLKTP
jgi:hypothetical protein